MTVTLYLWWILSNGILSYRSIDFLLSATQTNCRKHIPILLTISTVFVSIVTHFQIFGSFWMELPFWILYAFIFVKIQWHRLLLPTSILFTLRTFTEGFTAVLTAYVCANLQLASDGTWAQIFISLSFDVLFLFLLHWLQKHFVFAPQNPISPYPYTLLLPSSLMVLAIRYRLRLDSPNFSQYLLSLSMDGRFTILSFMIGAIIVFFILIQAFEKIIQFTEQIAAQQLFLDEAKTYNEQYASFRHDIKNHLLALSALIQETNYQAAQQYATDLQASYTSPSIPISTGNLILDVLLKEKLNHARSCEIDIHCKVQIPSKFRVEDMDLCILFSNLLDHAITACMEVESPNRVFHLTTKERANFLVIESSNSVATSQPIQKGIGLQNIEKVSKKYQGIMKVENRDGMFQICVLLCSLEK